MTSVYQYIEKDFISCVATLGDWLIQLYVSTSTWETMGNTIADLHVTDIYSVDQSRVGNRGDEPPAPG